MFDLADIRRKQVERGVDFAPYRPVIHDPAWTLVQDGYDGGAYQSSNGLRVIVSAAKEADGVVWLHMSASRPSRCPSYEDMVEAKRRFLGDRHAYQCFVPLAEHININPYVLHLWAMADGERSLPDFSAGTGTI